MKPDKYGRTIPDELRPYIDIADQLFSEHGLAHPIEVARALLAAEQRGMEKAAEMVRDDYVWDGRALSQATDLGLALHKQAEEIHSRIRQAAKEIKP